MKHIEFPKKWKRILAAFIDFCIMFAIFSIVYFPFVFPASFDSTTYGNNNKKSQDLFVESSIYMRFGDYVSSPTSLADFPTLVSYETGTVTYNSIVYTVNLGNNLHTFYTQKVSDYGGVNVSEEVYKKEILKVGSDTSALGDYTYVDGVSHFTLKEGAKETTAASFLDDLYTTAMSKVSGSPKATTLSDENSHIMLIAVLMAIPTLIGASIPFFLLIPLFSKNGKTIGKHIFHIAVLSKDGYELKKWKLLIRWLVYIVIEVLLGFVSCGASFLISYTMFLFAKNHRSIHDFAAGSVVADANVSFWFKDPYEESEYRERHENEKASI